MRAPGTASVETSASFSLKIGAYDGKLAASNRFELVLTDAPVEGSLIPAEVIRVLLPLSLQKCRNGAILARCDEQQMGPYLPAGGWMSYVKG
ncbi:hypothetical protein ACVMB0_000227 [Bradyrhizobium sp. USDA 4451]